MELLKSLVLETLQAYSLHVHYEHYHGPFKKKSLAIVHSFLSTNSSVVHSYLIHAVQCIFIMLS